MSARQIGEGKPDFDRNGEPNLIWYADKYYASLTENWPVVLPRYLRAYNNVIIPAMEKTEFGLGALARLENDDVEEILLQIRRDKGYCCAESTIRLMRYLIWCVYKQGFQNDHYEDKLRYEELGIFGRSPLEEDQQLIAKMMLMKKSLSIEEELRAAEWFKQKLNLRSEKVEEEPRGEYYGLLMMFAYGFRNAEACGLNYDAIVKIPDRDFSCVFVKTTTDGGSNELKTGGKTLNFTRVLPLYDFIETILDKRRTFIVDYIERSGKSRKEAETLVKRYPIGRKGNNYSERASRDDLTKMGRIFLREIIGDGYAAVNQATGQVLFKQKLLDASIDERDATTYLLRRSAATNYYAMGFSASQIQFLMGHLIEDPDVMRYFLVNPDRQKEIKDKIETHPMCIFFGGGGKPEQETIVHQKARIRSRIEIIAKEPNVGISLRIDSPINEKPQAVVSEGFLPVSEDTVDLRNKLADVARNLLSRNNK